MHARPGRPPTRAASMIIVGNEIITAEWTETMSMCWRSPAGPKACSASGMPSCTVLENAAPIAMTARAEIESR